MLQLVPSALLRQTCSLCRKNLRQRHCASRRYLSGDTKKYDILFCGSDSFSVASLAALLRAPDLWSSIRVVTSQPKPTTQQRKGKERANLAERPLDVYRPSLRDFAADHDLPIDLIDWKTGIAGYTPPDPFNLPSPHNARNLLITASFGYILPDAFLDLFYRTHKLNVHPSLLPRWRGAAPIQWTIASGDETTGVSVQRLASKSKGIDAGKLVGVAEGIPVPPGTAYWDLLPRLADEGGRLLVDTLRRMQAGTVIPAIQDAALITKAPKITHKTARVNWASQTAPQMARLARGIAHQEPLWTRMAPFPSQPTIDLQLLDPTSPPLSSIPTLARDGFSSISPGTGFLHKPTKALYIAAAPESDTASSYTYWERSADAAGREGEGNGGPLDVLRDPSFIKVEQIRPAGRKAMGVWEWYNGLSKEMRASKRVQFEV